MTDFGPTPSSFPVPPPPPPTRSGPPWENPGPPLQRFIDTLKGVLIDPVTTFSQMRREGGLQAPLIYFVLGMLIAVAGFVLWHILGFGMGIPLGGRMGGGEMAGAAAGLGFFLIGLPICYVIGLFIGSGILHLLLMLFGGQKFPYETTFRTYAYANGSALPLAFIPGCGGAIAGIWGLVVLIIGLAQMHETTTGKAAAAVLVPMVICCALFAVFFSVIAAMIGMAAAGAASGIH